MCPGDDTGMIGPGLLIDPARGMAGDMFSAALLSLGVPPDVIIGAMQKAARCLGRVSIVPERVSAGGLDGEVMAVKLHIRLEPVQPRLLASKAWDYLEEAIVAVNLSSLYASFGRRALRILIEAERQAHSDGWLPAVANETSASEAWNHQEMHRQGLVHQHQETALHEAQDILIDVVGAAVGLQYLNVDLSRVLCLSPVRVGGGFVTFSHGRLAVPAPATRIILQEYDVPYAFGPVEKEMLTPTGASLLAALQPKFRSRNEAIIRPVRTGIGRGLRPMEPPGDLRLGLWWKE